MLAGSLTLLDVAYQLLPEDHTDLVEVKVQQKVDSCSPAMPAATKLLES